MILKDILNGVSGTLLQGDLQQEINSITIDSRKTESNVLFVAIKGMKVDGHSFIGGAYEKGCRAVIVEEDVENLPQDMTVYKVSESREALTVIAGNFYEHPSKKLNMIGVTGTNGKTSTTYFMESILNTIGHKTGVIGTVETRIGGKKRDIKFATSTTPDTLDLNAILKLMADENVEDLVMEVSSHGLALKKVDGIDFNIGIFTNLTQDHLDFHKTMENYCLAKAKLFKMCKTGIINVDDKWSQKIIDEATCDIITYSIDEPSDLQAKNIHYLMDRVVFTVNINGADVDFNLKVPGRFSIYNALGVIGAALSMGIAVDDIQTGINAIKGVPGRIQSVPNDKGFNVIVDYAHTPDGLENILNAVREFTKGKVITVFGCGGDRDKTKRPIMGDIAARLGDYSIITSDNPRSEEPIDIINQVEEGVRPVTDDYEKIVAYKEETTDKLVQGVEQLLKANGVDVYDGKGTLLEEKKVRIRKEKEDVVLEGENIILASGSKPLILPIPGMDSERVLTSDALFAMKEAPKSLIIIGGGVISVEFATVYANLGCNAKVSTKYG